MDWFTWFERIVAHMCDSRQHEAPIEGHDPLSRTNDEDYESTGLSAEPHPFGGCMGGNNKVVSCPAFMLRAAL